MSVVHTSLEEGISIIAAMNSIAESEARRPIGHPTDVTHALHVGLKVYTVEESPRLAGGPVASLVTVFLIGAAMLTNTAISGKRAQVGAGSSRYEQVEYANSSFDVVRVSPVASPPSWVSLLEEVGLQRPDNVTYMRVVDGVIDLVSDDAHSTLDQIMATVRVDRVCTDFLISLLRLTFAIRADLTEWQPLLARVRIELGKREVDADLELVGLNSDDFE